LAALKKAVGYDENHPVLSTVQGLLNQTCNLAGQVLAAAVTDGGAAFTSIKKFLSAVLTTAFKPYDLKEKEKRLQTVIEMANQMVGAELPEDCR